MIRDSSGPGDEFELRMQMSQNPALPESGVEKHANGGVISFAGRDHSLVAFVSQSQSQLSDRIGLRHALSHGSHLNPRLMWLAGMHEKVRLSRAA